MDELIKALETAFKDDGIDIDIKYYDVEDDMPGVEKDEDEEDEEE